LPITSWDNKRGGWCKKLGQGLAFTDFCAIKNNQLMQKLFKSLLFLLVVLATPSFTVKAQQGIAKTDSAKLLIDTLLKFARKNSFFRDQVNWATVADSVRSTAAGATSIKAALPAVQQLFRLLGDHHAFITYGGKTYRWRKPAEPMDKVVYQNLLAKYKAGYGITPKRLEKRYGYLLVPDNNPTRKGDVQRIAQQLRDSLALFNAKKVKGIIIDVRLNPGGNMWPMIGGLGALFAEGKLGSFVSADAKMEEVWGIKHQQLNTIVYTGKDTVSTIKSRGKDLQHLKVVVLLGPYTRSSGEALAISFKGRPNTWFIGEDTGGYTTANESFQFTDKIGVFISASVEADRNGKVYMDKVSPDEKIIGGDNFDDLQKDLKVIAALKWLKK
jgi:carboxyl-terminal processing protease